MQLHYFGCMVSNQWNIFGVMYSCLEESHLCTKNRQQRLQLALHQWLGNDQVGSLCMTKSIFKSLAQLCNFSGQTPHSWSDQALTSGICNHATARSGWESGPSQLFSCVSYRHPDTSWILLFLFACCSFNTQIHDWASPIHDKTTINILKWNSSLFPNY